MLQRGDLVPHVTIRTLDGETVAYSTIWQHRSLVLIALPDADSDAARRYVDHVSGRLQEFRDAATACLITRDPIAGLPSPGVVVADQWGEIALVAAAADAGGLPSADELLEWIDYVRRQCPECQGETR